jgi:chloride channel 3/4/5
MKNKPKINKSTPVTPYTIPTTPKLDFSSPLLSKYKSSNSLRFPNHEDDSSIRPSISNSLFNIFHHATSYYNDFTTIDWSKAYISTNSFTFDAKNLHSWYYKAYLVLAKWLLIAFIGFVFSLFAFFIDKIEILLVGFKHGYCKTNWFASQYTCCEPSASQSRNTPNVCPDWISWSILFDHFKLPFDVRFDFIIYVLLSVVLASVACIITLTTKIVGGTIPNQHNELQNKVKPRIMYTASGSGVPEVKTILSGFVITKFLGSYTLIAKTIALILAIASGMSLGKEGPYVHLATCVGNVSSRLVPFIHKNDYLKKQILSASASAGVALAFGSPLGGVLFILEEINNYLPSHQLFQVFVCAIISTLFLKFMNPYGTGKTVIFELSYTSDWKSVEMLLFIIIGIAGGIFGAAYVKFVRWWPKTFRSLKYIKNHPIFEVVLISLLTGLITFWNPYTKQASSELVLDLATSCDAFEMDRSLCPQSEERLVEEIRLLFFAFIAKVGLTFVTLGLIIPCGIYVPSMVVGALFGRLFAMTIEWTSLHWSLSFVCSNESSQCVDFGIYAMISAGAFMAGVTRMNITLVTIMFELTSSYTYVLPISLAVAVANWCGGLIEKNSLYESMLVANDFPFMAPEHEPIDPVMTTGDIITEIDLYDNTTEVHRILNSSQSNNRGGERLCIDVSESLYVPFTKLQFKLNILRENCLLDGCIPLIKNKICVGLIYFSELEYCLDKIQEFCIKHDVFDEVFCRLVNRDKRCDQSSQYQVQHNENIIKNITATYEDYFTYGSVNDMEGETQIKEEFGSLVDLSVFVDTSPVFLNYDTELSFANLIFDRIGNRVIVLIKEGKHYGVLHKKVLIDYCRKKCH